MEDMVGNLIEEGQSVVFVTHHFSARVRAYKATVTRINEKSITIKWADEKGRKEYYNTGRRVQDPENRIIVSV